MSRCLAVFLILLVTSWAIAQPEPPVAPEILAQIKANEPESLPAYMTEAEKAIPIRVPPRFLLAPPSGQVYCPAEYEHNQGLLVSWESYTSILTQMIVTVTTQDPAAIMYVVVDNNSEKTTVQNTLAAAGADMSQVQFIVCPTDTVWIRDYGPRFIYEDGDRAIIDHTYNRPRPQDDAFNDYLSGAWGEPQYDIPLVHGGGNFHLFSNGDAFMTSLILNENPGLSAQDVINLYHAYQNVNLTITSAFPTWVDSTQHIDMWMLPLGDYKVLIGQYTFDPPRQITDGVAAQMAAQGYTVYRTPGWTSGGTHYTYTNAVIINDLVFISKFNHANDAAALATFQAALPGKTIYQIDCSSIIQAAGALHCIVMHVPPLHKFSLGDMNCDGAIDGFDIQPFVLALTDPGQYGLLYPNCQLLNGDINGDGSVDGFDIQPFVALLTGG